MDLTKQIGEAIRSGNLDAFSRLVGDDNSLPSAPKAFGSWLHYACDRGQLPIVKYLVETGADLNARADIFDAGPITNAASAGHLHIVEYLVSQGATLDVSSPSRNPLFAAIDSASIDIAKLLLDAGIEMHAVYRSATGKLRNALSYAQERGEEDIGDLLIKAGCGLPVEGVDKPVWTLNKVHEPTAEDKAREQIIARMAEVFGPADPLALQEILPVHDEVHVAVNVIRPTKRHPFLTLFTTGMSDRAMTVPKGQEEFQYAELVMHLPATWPHPRDKGTGEDTAWPFEWLRKVAYFPHLNETWLGGPTTIISSDEPPEPLGPNTKQTCLLLVADFTNAKPLALDDGKTVRFYTVMPLYTEERDFEKQRGLKALLQRLKRRGFTAAVNVDRPSVVGK